MKKLSNCIVAFICIVTLAGCGAAQKGAISWAYSDIKKGKYESALQNLSEAESYKEPTPDLKAEILHLRAICYAGLGRCDEAIGVLKYIIDKFPDSSYAYQARETLLRLNMSPQRNDPSGTQKALGLQKIFL